MIARKKNAEKSYVSAIRILGALLILASGVVLFATDGSKLFAPMLILGNLVVLFDDWRTRRERS